MLNHPHIISVWRVAPHLHRQSALMRGPSGLTLHSSRTGSRPRVLLAHELHHNQHDVNLIIFHVGGAQQIISFQGYSSEKRASGVVHTGSRESTYDRGFGKQSLSCLSPSPCSTNLLRACDFGLFGKPQSRRAIRTSMLGAGCLAYPKAKFGARVFKLL